MSRPRCCSTVPQRNEKEVQAVVMTGFASVVLRGLGCLVSGQGPRARLNILIYHRVLSQPDPLRPEEIDASCFDRQVGMLADCFNVIPLSDAVSALERGVLPPRAACVTFDDGYADNCEVALPILRRWGIPAAFFVSSGFLSGGCMWNDAIIEAVRQAAAPSLDLRRCGLGTFAIADEEGRRSAARHLVLELRYLEAAEREDRVRAIIGAAKAAVPESVMMGPQQVRELHNAGMEIGGHTVNHAILSRVARDVAHAEIAENKEHLEGIVGGPVRLFAYPNGRPGRDFDIGHVEIVKQLGFKAAVTTAWGAARATTPVYQLPRFTPWDRSPIPFALRLMRNYRKSAQVLE